jgi:hypothetical protein
VTEGERNRGKDRKKVAREENKKLNLLKIGLI